MKKQIAGYITGVINSYSRAIERLKTSGAPITSIDLIQAFKEEFTDLLEFVIDIPSEKNKEAAMLSFNVALQNEDLKNRILELEESCENMNQVEKNLHDKIEGLTGNNLALNSTCNRLRIENNKISKRNKSQVEVLKSCATKIEHFKNNK